ncbi:hypothetical protein ACQP2P_38645 [Dactylosporangium sp. CA-139114]|uniref:hypothetical protein n=1 Tax=Dactylosporangium sp. CA-139114 TaxID=3239931 RepID=UPI003D9754C3
MKPTEPRLHQLRLPAQKSGVVCPHPAVLDFMLMRAKHGWVDIGLDVLTVGLKEDVEFSPDVVKVGSKLCKLAGDIFNDLLTKPHAPNV